MNSGDELGDHEVASRPEEFQRRIEVGSSTLVTSGHLTPLNLLNLGFGIISLIWLAVLWDWKDILLGIVICVISFPIPGLLLLPSIHLGKLAASCRERSRVATFFLQTLGILSCYTLVGVWCGATMLTLVIGANVHTFGPRLGLAYGAATGAWMYMFWNIYGPLGENWVSTFVSLFAKITYLAVILLSMTYLVTPLGAVEVLADMMLLGFLLEVTGVMLTLRLGGI